MISFFQLLVWMLILGGFISCGKEFVLLWVGEEHLISYYVCSALLIINIIPCTQSCAAEILRSQNKHYKRAYIIIGTTLLNALITIILVNVFPKEKAILGCLIGTAISTFIGNWILLSIYNNKSINMPMGTYWLNFTKIVIISLVGVGIVFLMDYFVFTHIQINILILLVIKGAMFSIIFLLLSIFVFKQTIKNAIVLLRKKGD